MKKLYLLLFILLSTILSAQTFTTVTGTITDTSGQNWNYGNMTVSLRTTQVGTPLNQGHPITDTPQTITLSSTGTFSFTLDSNTAISPIGSFWNFVVCPNASAPCVTVGFPVTGTTVDISTSVNPHLGPLIINANNTSVVRAYSDAEAVGGNGALYWRTVDNTLRGCQATPSQTCGNGGAGVWTSIVSGGGITSLTGLFGLTLTPNPITTTGTVALTNTSPVALQVPFVDPTGTTLNWVTPGTNGCYLALNTSSGPFWDGNLCSVTGSPNNLTYNGSITALQFIGTGPYYMSTVIPGSPPTPTVGMSAFAVGSDGNFYLSNNGGAFAQILTGSSSSSVTGTGTTNNIAKWTGTSSVGNSSLIDNGTNPVGISLGTDIGITGGYNWQAVNNGTTGTTLNKLACDDGTGSAVICNHTTYTTNVPLGVAVHGTGAAAPGMTGNTGICLVGFCTVLFDSSATAGHYAQESATTDGELADVGTTVPTNGQVYFYIFSSNAGVGTTAVIRDLTGSELNAASSGGGGNSVTIQVNGSSAAKANKVNFNGTTPAAGTNGLNITWQTSTSGSTTSVSAEVVGDGTSTHFLSGVGTWLTPSSTGVTSVVIAGTANQITASGTCTITTTGTCTLSMPAGIILGTDNSTAGTIQLANGSANAHTIWSSGATTTNTIAGFTAVPTTGDLVSCTSSGTTCTFTDSGVLAANIVTASGTLTSTNIMTGAGSKTAQTPSSAATVDSSGNLNATTLIASGIVDGKAPLTLTTGASCTLGTASGCNATKYLSGYTFNQEGSAATAITYTLPTAAAGLQYCVANSYNGSNPTTGTLEILTSASGQFIIFIDGTLSATGGYVQSGGAAGDWGCVVGLDSTHWQFTVVNGTWTKH